jgi:predicted RNA binding protein YcfA (HicA-like mRNA interferase family)
MGKWEKVLFDVVRGTADANISFNDLCSLLDRLGFERRIRGSHNMFRRSGIAEKINLQKDGNKAKPYQVRQVRDVIVKYRLGDEING